MREFTDFEWTAEAVLEELAAAQFPWEHYHNTTVEFDGRGILTPCDDGAAGEAPPLGSLHVITAVQPDGTPDSPDSRARLALLDRELQTRRLRAIPAVGSALDGSHREESRAVFGLDDAAARELGCKFGRVAVFAWAGPQWSLLASANDRQDHRGWQWSPH